MVILQLSCQAFAYNINAICLIVKCFPVVKGGIHSEFAGDEFTYEYAFGYDDFEDGDLEGLARKKWTPWNVVKIRYVHTPTPSVPGLDFDAIMGPPSKAKPEAQAPIDEK